jgi:hypothetical protein
MIYNLAHLSLAGKRTFLRCRTTLCQARMLQKDEKRNVIKEIKVSIADTCS